MVAAAKQRDLEADEVHRRRNQEARDAGLSELEANVFAINDTDIGQLRKLVADGCPPDLIALIVV